MPSKKMMNGEEDKEKKAAPKQKKAGEKREAKEAVPCREEWLKRLNHLFPGRKRGT